MSTGFPFDSDIKATLFYDLFDAPALYDLALLAFKDHVKF